MATATMDNRDTFGAFERLHVHPAEGRVLIVGSKVYDGREDRRKRHKRALGIDIEAGQGVNKVLNLEDPPPEGFGPFAHVECCSVLEHCKRPWDLAKHICEVMEPGGTIFLTVPWVWRYHAYAQDLWRFTWEGVMELFPRIEWETINLAAEGQLVKRYKFLPVREEKDGTCWFPRTEILAFGRLCES